MLRKSWVLFSISTPEALTLILGIEHPEPPPMFELWHFALRHYLNLGFSKGSFWVWRECQWWSDVDGGKVFWNPDWAIVQPHEPGKVSWQT
jgi:hypothetical protein